MSASSTCLCVLAGLIAGGWVLSHFDGSRPGVITLIPNADGTLKILQRIERPERTANAGAGSKPYGEDASDGAYATTFTAYKTEVARAKGLPEPDNYETHTTVRDPNETFAFSFPDVDGRVVSNGDPRFKGKVVLAIVTGTWCPNCHDEAQYLVQLDKKYRDKGLAIVALDFEEPEQQAALVRERAFVKKYGVKYTYLIAGAPAEMWEKVPQAVNLNTWPATLFIGRDGKVRGVHSGFGSRATGEFHERLKQEFTAKIETLLAENRRSPHARRHRHRSRGLQRRTDPRSTGRHAESSIALCALCAQGRSASVSGDM